MADYEICPECMIYASGRTGVLPRAMAAVRTETGETSKEILDRYMTGVHERHLSGLSLEVTS